MGIIEIIGKNEWVIRSHIITYGNAANEAVTEMIREEIETMWNEPRGSISFNDELFKITFKITAAHHPELQPETIYENDDPVNNYFRIETFAKGFISFVDGLGSNTGYMKLDNLYKGSTTAAHEYGHTLGLKHPTDKDYRGKGTPGIMYPRGTLVDAQYQYDPHVKAGENGGTINPVYRKVKPEDIALLQPSRLVMNPAALVVGDFSSIWHDEEKPIV